MYVKLRCWSDGVIANADVWCYHLDVVTIVEDQRWTRQRSVDEYARSYVAIWRYGASSDVDSKVYSRCVNQGADGQDTKSKTRGGHLELDTCSNTEATRRTRRRIDNGQLCQLKYGIGDILGNDHSR